MLQSARHARRAHELYPRAPGPLRLLRNAELRSGEPAQARRRYEAAIPALRSGDPAVSRFDAVAAIDYAALLDGPDERETREALIRSNLANLSTMTRRGTNGYGLADVRGLAQIDETDAAFAALTEAVESGWIADWRVALRDPVLDELRADPRFARITEALRERAGVARAQLARAPQT